MTELPLSEAVAYNDEPLQELTWAIEASEGEFSLMLARCNYGRLRQQMVQRLKELCTLEIRELTLKDSAKTLFTTIREQLAGEQPAALMVLGLESVSDLDHVLVATNQVREEFRKHFLFPLVLWINDEVLKKLLQLAPDFESWATTTGFSLPTETLMVNLRKDADTLFRKLLELDVEQFFVPDAIFELSDRLEIDTALRDLELREEKLDPALQGSLEFAFGRQAYLKDETEAALYHYRNSLDVWQQTGQLERQGILLFHIALCYVRQAEMYAAKNRSCWEEARGYFEQSLEAFEEAQRTDVVAKFIPFLAEALQNLEDWEQLEVIARKSLALALHQNYPRPIWIAQDYGFLAEAALKQSRWEDAHQNAQRALDIIAQVPEDQRQHQGFFLLLLAKAQRQLGQEMKAIANLEAARELGPDRHPHLYIRILELLRSLYFKNHHYLNAFQVKQQQRSSEQQYGLSAFIGAGRLKSRRQVRTAFAPTEERSSVAQEIAASGRRGDVERLIQRIAKTQHKLTVLYGQSGVGKSSMVEAGLVPALKQQAIGTRDVVPILLRVYTNWVQELSKQLAKALKVAGISNEFVAEGDSLDKIFEQLQRNGEMNLLTVLIFDQFEEFFFTCCNDPNESNRFSQFFRDCLNTPFVKVVLSLREDYLHLLLQCSRHVDLDAINNNILDKEVLYYIGNFSPKDTKSIIKSLTERSKFHLETALVDELVKDLAGELGEVRPIELQVVGAQLQAENITTLEQYQKLGEEPQETLVQRYLEEVVKDCGPENQQAAELVLYLLTAENNTRPLKTRAELEKELKELAADLARETGELDLVLDIFVKSGLVFILPEIPANRYQLVHDYRKGKPTPSVTLKGWVFLFYKALRQQMDKKQRWTYNYNYLTQSLGGLRRGLRRTLFDSLSISNG